MSLIDLPVQKIYVPLVGYDDNDVVEMVVEGALPNPCYSLGKTMIGPIIGRHLSVRQLAWKSNAPGCEQERRDEPSPFTSTVEVGLLKEGDYDVEVSKKDGLFNKKFNVERAKSTTTDNFNYSALRSVDFTQIFYEGDEVFAYLNGVWTTKCQKLVEPIKVERQGDLLLVLPVLADTEAEPCDKAMTPYRYRFSLGRLEQGTYLIHARSRGGKGIYSPLQVWPHVDKE